MMSSLGQEFEFLRKTGRAASFGSSDGQLPFFTSSQEITKRTNVSDCEGPALVFGTGGAASIHFVEGPFSATNDCYVVIPKSGCREDAKYFYYFLRQNFHLIEDGFRGAGLRHVSKKHLEGLPLPVARNIDRRKVNRTLEKADDIRRKRQSALSLVDDLIKSEFAVRFGFPQSNSNNLPVAPLRSFGSIVTGNTPPRKNPENYGDDIEWIKSDNINTPSHFLTRAEEGFSGVGKKIGRIAPAGSTLITCIAGSPSVIGNAALADREVAFNQQINAVIPNAWTDPYFLYVQFLVGKELVQAQSTNSMKGLVSKRKFQEIEFLQPNYDDQTKFGMFFIRLIGIAAQVQADLSESEKLFGSIAQRGFRGEL